MDGDVINDSAEGAKQKDAMERAEPDQFKKGGMGSEETCTETKRTERIGTARSAGSPARARPTATGGGCAADPARLARPTSSEVGAIRRPTPAGQQQTVQAISRIAN